MSKTALQLLRRIKEIIFSKSIDQDKVIDIGVLLQRDEPEKVNIFGSEAEVIRHAWGMEINGAWDIDPMYEPTVSHHAKLYYSGCGCTWSTDDLGNRFWLLDKKTNRIYDEEARVKKIVLTILKREAIV